MHVFVLMLACLLVFFVCLNLYESICICIHTYSSTGYVPLRAMGVLVHSSVDYKHIDMKHFCY